MKTKINTYDLELNKFYFSGAANGSIDYIIKKQDDYYPQDFYDLYFAYLGYLIILDSDIESPDTCGYDIDDFERTQESICSHFGVQTFGVHEDLILLPVYRYSHSGDAFRTTPFGDRYDSWLSGFIYCKKEQWEKFNGGITKEEAEKILNEYVEAFSNWYNGYYEMIEYHTLDDEENEILAEDAILTRAQADKGVQVMDEKPYDSIDDLIKAHPECNLTMFNDKVYTKKELLKTLEIVLDAGLKNILDKYNELKEGK